MVAAIMEGASLLQDFATILLVAGLVGWFCRKAGLSAVVGFLVAGIIIGPYTPPFTLVTDVGRIETLSDLGLVFLMFFVGLDLSLKRIKRMGPSALIATAITAIGVFNLAQAFALAAGWSQTAGLIFAAMFMASSSAIITKMLAESGLTHERFAQNAQGVTVLEDVVAIVMLTLIGSKLQLAEGGAHVGRTVFLLLAFTVALVVIGLIFIPRLLSGLKKASDSDLASIIVAGLAFAAGVASINAGFSVALGAFLFGVVVAETPFKGRIQKALSGAQDMFSAIFFVSIGMLIDVRLFAENIWLIAGVAVFAIVARTLAATIGYVVSGNALPLAFGSALVVTPVGEFSYVIARMGVDAEVVPESFYAMAVGASIVTAILGPIFARNSGSAGRLLDRLQPAVLRNLLESYRRWLDTTSTQFAESRIWRFTRRAVGLTLLALLLLAALFGFADPIKDGIERFLVRANYEIPGWEFGFWAVVIVLAAILLAAIGRGLHALSLAYAEALTLRTEQVRILRPVVELVFLTFGAAMVAGILWFTVPWQLDTPWIGLALIIAPLVFVALLWRQLIRLHSRFEASLTQSAAMAAPHPRSRVTKVAADGQGRDWNLEVAEVVLPEQAACTGKSIGQLRLRSDFGCTILEVDRQGFVIANPGPETTLFPEDRVLLFGGGQQLEEAREFLSSERAFEEDESAFDETVLDTLLVPPDAPVVGKSLAELQVFPETGVQIMGIEREGRRILNPGGQECLLGNDRILVLATRNEIRGLRNWLVEF